MAFTPRHAAAGTTALWILLAVPWVLAAPATAEVTPGAAPVALAPRFEIARMFSEELQPAGTEP